MLQYSTGRGGAGNIRSPSIGGARAEEDVGSPARGREPVSQVDRVTHVGRGGAGNIRSPSREPRDACESSSFNSSCFPPALYFSLRCWSRCRRWGTLQGACTSTSRRQRCRSLTRIHPAPTGVGLRHLSAIGKLGCRIIRRLCACQDRTSSPYIPSPFISPFHLRCRVKYLRTKTDVPLVQPQNSQHVSMSSS